MSLLDLNLTDIPDDLPVPKGEYLIVLRKTEITKSKKSGDNMIKAMIEIDTDDFESVAPIWYYMVLPGMQDDLDTLKMKKRKIKRFCEAFSISYNPSGFDLETGWNNSCWAILGVEESEEYGDKNTIERFVLAK